MTDIRDMLIAESKNFVYTPKINESIILVNESRAAKRAARPNKKPAFYPSGLSHPCKRNIFCQYNNIEGKKKDVRILRIFRNGDYMHNRYAEYAKQAGILVAHEMRLKSNEYRIRGKLDQIVLIDNQLYIVDLKSMKDSKWCEMYGVPSRDYYEQLQVYMWLINDLFYAGSTRKIFKQYPSLFPIKKAILLVENKDNQKQEEILIEYDEKRIEEIKEKLKSMIQLVDKGEFPKRELLSISQDCRWCDYREYCEQKDMEEFLKP